MKDNNNGSSLFILIGFGLAFYMNPALTFAILTALVMVLIMASNSMGEDDMNIDDYSHLFDMEKMKEMVSYFLMMLSLFIIGVVLFYNMFAKI